MKAPRPDRAVRVTQAAVSIAGRDPVTFRWYCDRPAYPSAPASRHLGQLHATWGEALHCLRRHEWEQHHERPPLPTALNMWQTASRPRPAQPVPLGQIPLPLDT